MKDNKEITWRDVTEGKGAQVFKEFFKDWTCPTWVSKTLHVGSKTKRSSRVNYYFDKFVDVKKGYLASERMKIGTRTGTFYRGTLVPFYEYIQEQYGVSFTDLEKKVIEWYIWMPTETEARDRYSGFINLLDRIKEDFIWVLFVLCRPHESMAFKNSDQVEKFILEEDFKGISDFIDNEIKKDKLKVIKKPSLKEKEFLKEFETTYQAFDKNALIHKILYKFIREKLPDLPRKLMKLVPYPYKLFIASRIDV